MGFKQSLEMIEAVMERRPARAVVESATSIDEDINLSEDWGERWTWATLSWYLGGVMEELIQEGKPRADVEACMQLVIERLMDPISPEEKDVSPDIGTVDEPSHAQIPRGFKGNPAKLAPTYLETQTRVAQQLLKMAPKSVAALPIEDIENLWAEACGKLINMGKAISIETRAGGETVIGPNYGLAWTMLKQMLNKMGIDINASKEKTIVKDAEDLVKKSAATLGAMAKGQEISGKEAKTASAMLRGAKQKKMRSQG